MLFLKLRTHPAHAEFLLTGVCTPDPQVYKGFMSTKNTNFLPLLRPVDWWQPLWDLICLKAVGWWDRYHHPRALADLQTPYPCFQRTVLWWVITTTVRAGQCTRKQHCVMVCFRVFPLWKEFTSVSMVKRLEEFKDCHNDFLVNNAGLSITPL